MEHIVVHGRCNYLLAGASHYRGREHIVGNAVCYLADNIRARRSYHHNVRLLCDRDVLDTVLEVSVKGVDKALVLSERLKCERVDEIERVWCHCDVHLRTELHEHTCKAAYFIYCNGAADSEQDCFSFKHGRYLRVIDYL